MAKDECGNGLEHVNRRRQILEVFSLMGTKVERICGSSSFSEVSKLFVDKY